MFKRIHILTVFLYFLSLTGVMAQYTGGAGSGYVKDTSHTAIPLGDLNDTDIVAMGIVTQLNETCGQATQMIDVAIFNAGAHDLDSIPVHLEIQGNINTSASAVYLATLPSREGEIISLGPVDLTEGGMLEFIAYTNHPHDMFRNNDTVYQTYNIHPNASMELHNDTLCQKGNFHLSASGNADYYEWFLLPTGGDEFYTGETFIDEDRDYSVFYYVEGVNQNTGCRTEREKVSGIFLDGPESGTNLVKAAKSQGVRNDGTQNDPDLLCAETYITYEIMPPYFMEQQDYNSKWNISGVTVTNQTNESPKHFVYTPPTPSQVGTIEIKPGNNQSGETFEIGIEFFHISGNCYHNYTHFIKVVDKPMAAFAFPAEICDNDHLVFENTSIYQETDSIIYKWQIGEDTVFNTNETDDFSYLLSHGAHEITLKSTSPAGCISDTSAILNVYPSPQVSFNAPEEVCVGERILFENQVFSVDSLHSIHWDFGDDSTSDASNPVHTYKDSGRYTAELEAITINGCYEKRNLDIIVRHIPEKEILHEGNCQDEPYTFWIDDHANLASWNWHIEEGTFQDSVISYVFTQHGAYHIGLSFDTQHGCRDTVVNIVNVHELPISSFMYDKNDPFVSFTATQEGLPEYHWDFGDGTQSTERYIEHEYIETGKYVVTLETTNDHGCSAVSSHTIEIISVFLEEIDINNEYTVYPNPVNDYLTITRNPGQSPVSTIQIIDMSGRIIISQTLTDDQQTQHNLPVNTLEEGSYWLNFTNKEGNSFNRKVQVIR